MIETPIFIPNGDERLAGVVTLPEGRPRGLAVLLQGLGAPRSHKYGLWTRSARVLAERDIASLRVDHPTLGDSTGILHADLHDPPVDEFAAATRAVMEIIGVDVYAAVGNCMGGRTALGLAAALPGCASVGCILPGNLDSILPQRDERFERRRVAGARRLAARIPGLKKAVRKLQRSNGVPLRIRFLPVLPTALRSSRVQVLYLGAEEPYDRLRRNLQTLQATLVEGDRLQIARIPSGKITSFRLPIDLQTDVIDAVVTWIDETMPGAARSASGAPLAGVAERVRS